MSLEDGRRVWHSPAGPALPPELRLVAACAAWPPNPASAARVRACLVPSLDWDRVLQLVRRHRVAGLVNRALSPAAMPDVDVPAEVRAALSGQATVMARRNLQLAAESVRIHRLMAAAGIDAAFLKGTALAKLAYDNIGLRHSKDIDLLVAPAALEAALAVLVAAGYRVSQPAGLHSAQMPWLKRFGLHVGLLHADSGIEVELHWRGAENPHLMPDPPPPTAWMAVSLGNGASLRTLPRNDLFLYLCIHGARHGWFRMKWLVDLAALTASMDEAELLRLVDQARDQGVMRPLSQGLLLASSLLAAPLPAPVVGALSADPVVGLLVRAAGAALRTLEEPYDLPFGLTWIRLGNYLLKTGWRFRLAQLVNDAMSQDDWEAIPLPTSLMFLYPILRLPLWAGRKVGLWARRLAAHG